jgi:hypothetical protein
MARYDAVPWTQVRVEESTLATGPWDPLETQNLSTFPGGVDADPAAPRTRDITTDEALISTGGYYRIVFLDASGNEQIMGPVHTSGYPSFDEIVAESNATELTGLDDGDQETLYTAAVQAIEEYTGQRFDVVTEERTLEAQGGTDLYLPARLDSISAISFPTGSPLTLTDLALSERHDRLYVKSSAGYGYYAQTIMEMQGHTGKLSFPSGQVKVTGAWGWSSFPSEVRQALRVDMEDNAIADSHQLGPSIRAYRAMGVRDIKQGGMTLALDRPVPISPRAARLLEEFVWQPALGQMV